MTKRLYQRFPNYRLYMRTYVRRVYASDSCKLKSEHKRKRDKVCCVVFVLGQMISRGVIRWYIYQVNCLHRYSVNGQCRGRANYPYSCDSVPRHLLSRDARMHLECLSREWRRCWKLACMSHAAPSYFQVRLRNQLRVSVTSGTSI